jgi:lipopolysaccharide biosynthesis protein
VALLLDAPIAPPVPTARVIALYLPQFHPIPENDVWWGKGFTEWTNVAKAQPLFPGHYQPRIPTDLGFYDLRVPETRAAQAELASAHGIEAFCYWHYWFAGERLLERPFDEVLESGEPQFPFCLAWANQTWTGIWHGAPNRVLKEQTYPGAADHVTHFRTLLPAFRDPRYLRVDGLPLFVIYRPTELPGALGFTKLWRDLAVSEGLGGMYLLAMTDERRWDPAPLGFDASIIVSFSGAARGVRRSGRERITRRLGHRRQVSALVRSRFAKLPTIYDYDELDPRRTFPTTPTSFEWHPCLVPNWDNTPRSGVDGKVLHDSTPALFRVQLSHVLNGVRDRVPERRFVFIKSWNEWAEGNYLEPDVRFGNGYLEVTRDEVLLPQAAAPLRMSEDGSRGSV